MNYIDIGIDFGAENIVVIAIGYDSKGRKDYKLINLDSNFSIKNYIGQKPDESYDIGSDVKLSYAHHNLDKSYNWVEGRYKSHLSEETRNDNIFQKSEKLAQIGLDILLNKIESFDFSPFFQGTLRNISVGIPQAWDNKRKDIYFKSLANWQHGEVFLLSEPVAATISAIHKSVNNLQDIPVMILDIGASTLDISFSRYEDNNIKVYKTAKRIDKAGHFFDIIFASFAISVEINKQAKYNLILRADILKLRKVEDYIKYINDNQSKYSSLLLEIESIKENNLTEIIKFNKKKLIDTSHTAPLTINKEIYDSALKFYISMICKDINLAISDFEKEITLDNNNLYPVICGGGSSLFNFEKRLKENIKYGDKTISISEGNKIDITIALGLAYYAQDKSIISKALDTQISCDFFIDDTKDEIILFDYQENYPLKEDKKLSSLINSDKEIIFYGESKEISFNLNFKKENKITKKLFQSEFKNIEKGNKFDLSFNLDINERLIVNLENLSNGEIFKSMIFADNL